jgi:purine-binding chemotaxis protein CheW
MNWRAGPSEEGEGITMNSTQANKNTEQPRQYSTFYVSDLFFGVDVLNVQEVLRYQEMTRVPLAPDVIEGLINLRGQIVTAVDLRKRLNVRPRDNSNTPMNIVVRSEEGAVSLLVDEISDVLTVNQATYEPPPQNLPPEQRELIDGLYKLDGRLLLILNTDRVLQIKTNGN